MSKRINLIKQIKKYLIDHLTEVATWTIMIAYVVIVYLYGVN